MLAHSEPFRPMCACSEAPSQQHVKEEDWVHALPSNEFLKKVSGKWGFVPGGVMGTPSFNHTCHTLPTILSLSHTYHPLPTTLSLSTLPFNHPILQPNDLSTTPPFNHTFFQPHHSFNHTTFQPHYLSTTPCWPSYHMCSFHEVGVVPLQVCSSLHMP